MRPLRCFGQYLRLRFKKFSVLLVSVSGAVAGDRRNGQNLPLKIRSIIKPLKVKSSKSSFKVTTNCQCKFITIYTFFVVSRINLIIWQLRNVTSIMPRYGLGMLSVLCRNYE